MNMKAIKAGDWYETTHGIGRCTAAGGTFPPTVRVNIVSPFPRGIINLAPKDVLRRIQDPPQGMVGEGDKPR